jgi:hypothetical protein
MAFKLKNCEHILKKAKARTENDSDKDRANTSSRLFILATHDLESKLLCQDITILSLYVRQEVVLHSCTSNDVVSIDVLNIVWMET